MGIEKIPRLAPGFEQIGYLDVVASKLQFGFRALALVEIQIAKFLVNVPIKKTPSLLFAFACDERCNSEPRIIPTSAIDD